MLGGEVDEASMISGLYLNGSVSVSPLGYFCLLVLLINLLIIPWISLSNIDISTIFSIRRGVGSKNSLRYIRIRPVVRRRGSEKGRQPKQIWLLGAGRWSLWNKEQINQQSSTNKNILRIIGNKVKMRHHQIEIVLLCGRGRTFQGCRNHRSYRINQR